MAKKLRVTFEIDCSNFEDETVVTAREFAIDNTWQLFFHDAILSNHEKLCSVLGRDNASLEPAVSAALEKLYNRNIEIIKEAQESAKYEWIED
jgi:hypothetical protein